MQEAALNPFSTLRETFTPAGPDDHCDVFLQQNGSNQVPLPPAQQPTQPERPVIKDKYIMPPGQRSAPPTGPYRPNPDYPLPKPSNTRP